MYTHILILIQLCICVCIYIYIYTHQCVCIYTHIYIHTFTNLSLSISLSLYIYIYIHTHIHIICGFYISRDAPVFREPQMCARNGARCVCDILWAFSLLARCLNTHTHTRLANRGHQMYISARASRWQPQASTDAVGWKTGLHLYQARST